MPALAHFGIGLATKRFAPQIPLWALLISAMLIDLLSFIFISALWISHGLFMSVIWTIVAMIITAFITMRKNIKNEKDKINKSISWSMIDLNTTLIIGLVVFSHWVLDLIGWPMSVINPNATGVPLLFNDAVNIGLGVYRTWIGALSMDLGVFFVGLGIYIHYMKRVKK